MYLLIMYLLIRYLLCYSHYLCFACSQKRFGWQEFRSFRGARSLYAVAKFTVANGIREFFQQPDFKFHVICP